MKNIRIKTSSRKRGTTKQEGRPTVYSVKEIKRKLSFKKEGKWTSMLMVTERSNT